MLAGMAAGGHFAVLIGGPIAISPVFSAFVGMSLGMIIGMLIGHVMILIVLQNSRVATALVTRDVKQFPM